MDSQKNALQTYAPLAGRFLLALIFLGSGFNKITGWDGSAAYMAAKGMPMVPLFLVGAIVLELVGGLSVLLGFKARLGAIALIVFLVPATIIFHNPSGIADAQAQQQQMIHMMKNLAIIGGLLMVVSFGSGGMSLDNRLKKA